MNNLPNAEEIADIFLHSESHFDDIIEAMKEYGRQVRDKTLEWVVENATTETNYESDGWENWEVTNINKNSILNGKTSKDLEI